MISPAERQYLTRHQSDIDALLAALAQRDLLRDSVRENWKHAVRSALMLRNQLKGTRAFKAEGFYRGTLVDIEYAFTRFIRLAGDDGASFDRDEIAGYRALVDLQETVAQKIDQILEADPALATYSSVPAEIPANSERVKGQHGL